MFTRKIALGIGGTLIVLAGGFGIATQASAEPAATPTPTPAMWQRGGGNGMQDGTGNRMQDGTGSRMQDGTGIGATRHAAYLADQLGVSAEAVTDALEKLHATADAGAVRGRDATAEQRAAQHEAMAKFLATELKIDESRVLEVLGNGCGAGAGGGMGGGFRGQGQNR